MKRLISLALPIALFAGAALAQETPPPPPPGGDGPAATDAGGPPPPPPGKGPNGMPGGGPGGPGGPRSDRFAPPPPPPPSKAARFTVDLGEGRLIAVKCADDEPMKACADIAAAMLDRVAPPRP